MLLHYSLTKMKFCVKIISMRNRLLVTANLDFLPSIKTTLNQEYELKYINKPSAKVTEKIIKDFAPKYWICNPAPGYTIDKKFLNKPLTTILTPSTGTSHIDFSATNSHNISVYSIGTEAKIQEIKASSEYTFLLLLSMFRNMKQIVLNKNLDSWRVQEDSLRGYELYGKTVGIVGFGRNGKNMAKYCNAFGMKIFFYDPYHTSKNYIGNQCHSLEELCVKVDALILTVTSSRETKNLITSEILDLLKPNSIVINTSRGEVINQRDLIKHVKTGKIYFALDVLSDEENFRTDSLKLIKMSQTYKNLLITPHVAGLTFDSERKAMLIIMTILSRIRLTEQLN